MFAVIEKAYLLKKIVEATRESLCLDEVCFVWDVKGITLRMMDPEEVLLADLQMNEAAFSDYSCGEKRVFGVSLDALKKILDMCNDDDAVTWRHEGENDYILLTHKWRGGRKMRTRLPLLDVECKTLCLPGEGSKSCDYSCMVTMPATELQMIFDDYSRSGRNRRRSSGAPWRAL